MIDGAGPIAVLTPPDVQELPQPDDEESRDLIVSETTTVLDAESETGVSTTELPPELRLRGVRGVLKGRITTKIVLPFIILMFVLAIGGTWFVLNQVTGSLVQRFQNQLLDAGKNANDSIITMEGNQLSLLRLMANTEGVDTALVKHDATTLQNLLLPLQANSNFQFVDVVDASGNEWLKLRPDDDQYKDAQDPNIANWQVTKDSLANTADQFGNKYTELVNTSFGPFIYTGGPVLDANGNVVGAVMIGMPFNDLIAQLTKDAAAPVTVYNTDGTVFGTSLPVKPGDPPLTLSKKTIGAVAATSSAINQNTVQRPVKAGGTSYLELLGGLIVRDKIAGLLGVAVPTNTIDEAGSTTRTLLSIMFTGITLVILIIGVFMANRISTPLKILVKACQMVARGDLEERVAVNTRDETGVLAHSFNQMIDGLKERDRIRDTFGRYMTKQVSDAILKGDVKLGGEMRDVTIFMTNIRGFEELSNEMEAENLVDFLNSYFSTMIDAVVAHDGVVDKFMEDAILVVFGAPVHDDEHPTKAVLTALDMRERLIEYNEQLIAQGHTPIRIGMGVNSGNAITGNIGSEVRMEYTVISDTVNATQRTRELVDQFKTDILISETTAARLDGRFILGEPHRITLRGRRQESLIYPVIGARQFEEGDESWRSQGPVFLMTEDDAAAA